MLYNVCFYNSKYYDTVEMLWTLHIFTIIIIIISENVWISRLPVSFQGIFYTIRRTDSVVIGRRASTMSDCQTPEIIKKKCFGLQKVNRGENLHAQRGANYTSKLFISRDTQNCSFRTCRKLLIFFISGLFRNES